MDYILQKDADSKAARKRKNAAAKAAAAAAKPTAAAGNDAAKAGTNDPQAAAAALRAFGAVVDLCTQPGCRRFKLLRHFRGEVYSPKKPVQQMLRPSSGSSNSSSSTAAAAAAGVMRCCDYCDNPSAVEAAQQQLKDVEVALLQRFRGRGGWQRGNGKRQRLGDGMFGGAGSGSEDESGQGEALSLIVETFASGAADGPIKRACCCA
jgi:hypothetical protein